MRLRWPACGPRRPAWPRGPVEPLMAGPAVTAAGFPRSPPARGSLQWVHARVPGRDLPPAAPRHRQARGCHDGPARAPPARITPHKEAHMRLTEHERERLLITLAADVAERR